MGKRKDKLEEMYQEIDSKYRNFSESEIKELIAVGEARAEENSEEVDKIKETIKTKEQLIAALMDKESSPRIQKAIADAETELKEAQGKLQQHEHQQNLFKKGQVNLRAYSKNKAQIQQIRAVKANMEKKLPEEIKKRDESEAKIKTAETELKEVLKTLSDEKLTMNMMGDEYNNLQIKKESLEKELKEQTEFNKKSKERILELEAKIGKCDLAWKTLFTGKTWDDIQRRALDPNRKFTRKVDENSKLKPENAKGKKLSPEEQMKADIAKTVDDVQKEQQENNGKDKNEGKSDLPVPTQKHPRWEKFKNFFKNAGRKIKEIFVGEEEAKEPDYSKMDNIPADKRDQFLEELRKHVDKEYGKEVREQKEAKYIEQHQAKPRANETEKADKSQER